MNTSLEAYESVKPVLGNLQSTVFNFIFERGKFGATADEVEESLDLLPQTATPRIYELRKDQEMIVDSGMRRKTRSGRNAIVWVAVEYNQ